MLACRLKYLRRKVGADTSLLEVYIKEMKEEK